MITLVDLEQAIHECQAEREPNANTCIKLAAFLTIKRECFINSEESAEPAPNTYSYAPPPDNESEFIQKIRGMDSAAAWKLIDDLMSILQVVNKRLYDGVMTEIEKSLDS